MNRVKLLCLVLIAVCTFFNSYASIYVDVDGVYYELDSSTMTATVGQFNSCEGEIIIPNMVMFNGRMYSVISIGRFAFAYNRNLTSIEIPNSVTKIDRCAFQYCSGLTSISIPCSVTSIGVMAFSGCSGLKTVVIDGSVTNVGDEVFFGCSSLTSVEIGDSVTTIGFGMFKYCDNLDSVTIGRSVSEICSYAFFGCSSLTSIMIPDSVALIGKEAFSGCSGLTSVTIGSTVAEICEYAFNGCANLNEIISMNTTPPMCSGYGGHFLIETYNQAVLKIPAGCEDVYSTADVWKYFVNIVEITPVKVSTEENNAKFEIPTVENAVTYTVNVYSDEAMTQLIATTSYDAEGNIVPMSTLLELPINGFDNGTYYYEVAAKSESGETLSYYTGTFEISTSGFSNIANNSCFTERTTRYDIHGNLLYKPTKGINIVKMSNGTIRKELVK